MPLNLARDENGWTILSPSVDSRLIHVSPTGNNSNTGLSPYEAKQSIASGVALLRNGFPDWLMLECGGTYGGFRLEKTGRSFSEPLVITSYGSGERPIINNLLWWGETVKKFEYVAITNLQFIQNSGGALNFGLQITTASNAGVPMSSGILIENCNFEYSKTQMQIQGGFHINNSFRDITIRRNTFLNGRDFGLQLNWCKDILLEENLFYKSGWDLRTVQLHCVYMKEGDGNIVRNNIFFRGGSQGLKFAGNYPETMNNFLIEGNIFYQCFLGLGHSDLFSSDPFTTYTHNNGIVRNNIFLKNAKTIPYNSSSTQSIGLNIGNLNRVLFDQNLFIHNDDILSGGQIFRFADPSIELSKNITARNNIVYNWLSTHYNSYGTYNEYANSVENFVEINNLASGVTYPDPARSLATYNQYIGNSGDEFEFIEIAKNLNKDNWNVQYTAKNIGSYIRQGFGLTSEHFLFQTNNLYFILYN